MSAWRYTSLEDFLASHELTVDGKLNDGWGADVLVKGCEVTATILFADITAFSSRTADMTPTETLLYVNTFFAWITAEALQHGRGVVDKYIGDEVMVIFAKEFGSADPFAEAVQTARWICEHDVLDYAPHIGIATGPVVVGHVGSPLKHNTSVFGAAVAMASRCAGVKPHVPDDKFANHIISFPSENWGERKIDDLIKGLRTRMPDGTIEEDPQDKWSLTEPFPTEMKNLGDVQVRQILDVNHLRINQGWSAESRAREALDDLRKHNRYWPGGRETTGGD